MPLMEKGVQLLSNRMPKVISPKTHAIIDYCGVVAPFIIAGVIAWKGRQKRAAISSWICAGADAAISLMTDYPGGVTPLISYDTHLKMDAGLAGLIGSMPLLMGFSEDWPSWFFRSEGMAIAATTGMSDATGVRTHSRFSRRAA